MLRRTYELRWNAITTSGAVLLSALTLVALLRQLLRPTGPNSRADTVTGLAA